MQNTRTHTSFIYTLRSLLLLLLLLLLLIFYSFFLFHSLDFIWCISNVKYLLPTSTIYRLENWMAVYSKIFKSPPIYLLKMIKKRVVKKEKKTIWYDIIVSNCMIFLWRRPMNERHNWFYEWMYEIVHRVCTTNDWNFMELQHIRYTHTTP